MLPPRPLQAPSGQHRVSGRPYSGSKAAAPKLGGPSSPPSAGPSASPGQGPPPGGFPASSSPLVTLLRVPPLLPVLGCRGTQRGKDGVLALICISAEQRAPPPVPAEAGGGGSPRHLSAAHRPLPAAPPRSRSGPASSALGACRSGPAAPWSPRLCSDLAKPSTCRLYSAFLALGWVGRPSRGQVDPLPVYFWKTRGLPPTP